MLYMLRHGQTDWNKEWKLQGQVDIPLNDAGRNMAIEAGKRHKDINIDMCFCSPLNRARETAELFLKGRDVPITGDDRLKEMSFGNYEGFVNVLQDKTCPISDFFHAPDRYKAEGGAESIEELAARTAEFYTQVVAPLLDNGKDILLVGHGAMNCALIGGILNIPKRDFWKPMTDNCKLITISRTHSADGSICSSISIEDA